MILTLIVTLLSFMLVFFTTQDIKMAMIFTICSASYCIFYASQKIKKYNYQVKNIKECSYFINTFIVSLSISNSIEKSFRDVTLKASKTLEKAIKKINTNDSYQALLSLSDYFKVNNYKVFLNLLNLYSNNGGNILEMSIHLQTELHRSEELLNTINTLNIRKIYEFSLLWAFSVAIILFCRFGIGNVYEMMQSMEMFNYELMFFFGFMIFSFHLEITTMVNSIRRVINNV